MDAHKTKKVVTVTGHAFDTLPGHITLTTRGQGSSTRVAAMRAIDNLLSSRELKGKRVRSFKIGVVIEVQEVTK